MYIDSHILNSTKLIINQIGFMTKNAGNTMKVNQNTFLALKRLTFLTTACITQNRLFCSKACLQNSLNAWFWKIPAKFQYALRISIYNWAVQSCCRNRCTTTPWQDQTFGKVSSALPLCHDNGYWTSDYWYRDWSQNRPQPRRIAFQDTFARLMPCFASVYDRKHWKVFWRFF